MIAEHVKQRGHEPVAPTLRMLRHWWSRLNDEVFGGVLLPCQLEVGPCSEHKAVGLCYPLDCGRVRIVIDPSNATRAGMLATLAHEMVHQYQHQHSLPLTHGESFTQWADPIFGLSGLTI